MKTVFTGWILSGALLCGMAAPGLVASAMAEGGPEADLSVAAYSQYIWRGYAASSDSLVIQPSLTVAHKGFAFNLWGNLDTDQKGMNSEAFNWNETDITLSYDGSAGIFGYSAGYIYYDLDGIQDTQEFYLGASLDTLLSPSFTLYREMANAPGWYANLAVSHSFAMGDKMSLDLGLSIGYLDDDDGSDLHDGVFSVCLPIALSENLTVSPELNVSMALSSEAEDRLDAANLAAYNDKESTFVYGGVSASLAF